MVEDTTHLVQNVGMQPESDVFRVVFVCTGNICRSPMAEVVFNAMIRDAGLQGRAVATSAGTGDWHVGERADGRTLTALATNGYDGTAHRAKQFTGAMFRRTDLVVALDRSHERILQTWARDETELERISLLLNFDRTLPDQHDVPDPYYADQPMFDDVLTLIKGAVRGLVHQLEPALRAT